MNPRRGNCRVRCAATGFWPAGPGEDVDRPGAVAANAPLPLPRQRHDE
jgi:hypothetical protein